MNNKDFINQIAERTGLGAKECQILADALVAEMTHQLEDGNILNLPAFGTFEVKQKMERICIHPQTGTRMLVPPRLVVNFKPASALKERMQKGGQNG